MGKKLFKDSKYIHEFTGGFLLMVMIIITLIVIYKHKCFIIFELFVYVCMSLVISLLLNILGLNGLRLNSVT
jgi:uncharacterized membrane protein